MDSAISLTGKGQRRPASGASSAYLNLVREFALASIRDDTHLHEALAVIDRLLGRPLSEGEEMYLDALTDLVERYEDAHVEMPAISGVAMLRHLMDTHNLRQRDLVPLFGTESIVSEVLSGKRRLALSHIQNLARYFQLPADVFMDAPGATGR